ncbi:MAG: class I adenylate-forming enzyme family protein [Nitrososphaerales archaeon]
MILPDLLKKSDKNLPCIEDGVSLTYGDLDSLSSFIAAELVGKRLGQGDRVAVLLPNSWHFVAVFFGIVKAGCIATLLDYRSSSREVDFYLEDSKASLLFVEQSKFEKLALNSKVPVKVLDTSPHSTLKTIKNSSQDLPYLSEDDVVCILHTGGTTGKPKGVMLTHRNFSAVLASLSKAWSLERGKEVFGQILPMTHSGGLNCGINSALLSGGPTVMIRKFDPSVFIGRVQKYGITTFAGVPTIYWSLTSHESLAQLSSSSLRLCFCSGAPLSSKIAELFRKKTGITINVGWGLTEASPQLTVAPFGIFKENYVGKPINGTELVSLDSNDNPNEIGEIGELAAKGPQIMKGYWMNEKETALVFTKDRYLKTGDIGYVSDEGVYLLGRKKDVINSGGYKIWPHEVEKVLMENEKVKEAAVVGVKDETYGEAVKAFIVLNSEIKIEELKSFCKARLSSYKVPKYFDFVDNLPRSSVGKILHRVLRQT